MSVDRRDAEFESGTDWCRAWVYRPARADAGPRACIVMAHGLGGTRDAGLEPFARKFAEAGYGVVLFDYRHFGASGGAPRQLVSIRRQLQDWAGAIRYARGLPGIDPDRIALWGTSLSGGHVIAAGVRDGRIAAVSAQAPMTDGFAALRRFVRYAGFGAFLRLAGLGLLDQVRAVLRMPPRHNVPLVARPGELAAMSTPDAEPGYRAIAPPGWRNEICARFALTFAFYRPVARARGLSCPVLIQVCLQDSVAPAKSAIATAHRIGTRAELREHDCGHFDVYLGEEFERFSNEQLEFLDRTLQGRRQ